MNHSELLRLGVASAQRGDKASARRLLRQATESNPEGEVAWMWLASVAASRAELQASLEVALSINPDNQEAREWLRKYCPEKPAGKPFWQCPICARSADVKPWRCPGCNALLTLADVGQFFEREVEVDRSVLLAAMPRFDRQDGSTSELVRNLRQLALLQLNLRQDQKALETLRGVKKLQPDDAELGNAVEELSRRLDPPRQDRLKSEVVPSLEPPPSETPKPVPEEPARDVETQEFQAPRISPREPAETPKPASTVKPAQTAKPEPSAGGGTVAGLSNVRLFPGGNQRDAKRERVVLVVDDSPTIGKMVAMTLEHRGYRVEVATDGMKALAMLQDVEPDLVLLDVVLPHLDGYQVFRVIKENDETCDVPVVMLTGKNGFFDRVKGRMAGAADYITKPFDPKALLHIVTKHCGEPVS